MEDLVESLARGNVTEVKVLLASVALALAVYQLVLIAVGYGKVRPPFLDAGPATRAHRASGDAIVVLVVVTARLGPTSAAEQEAAEERQEQRLELQEERRELREERLENGG